VSSTDRAFIFVSIGVIAIAISGVAFLAGLDNTPTDTSKKPGPVTQQEDETTVFQQGFMPAITASKIKTSDIKSGSQLATIRGSQEISFNTYTVTNLGIHLESDEFFSHTIYCDRGDKMLAGGYGKNLRTVSISESKPTDDGGWKVSFKNWDDLETDVGVYALCLKLSE